MKFLNLIVNATNMSIEKKYYLVTDKETVNLLIQHIQESKVIAYDTVTDSLNMRQGQIIGFSVSGDIGMGFYLPTMAWNHQTGTLDELKIEGVPCHSIAKKILPTGKGGHHAYRQEACDAQRII